jgi:aminoglycoside/choline kinase family phosphotransferase
MAAGSDCGIWGASRVTRNNEIELFLSAHGWKGSARSPLAGDASARRYERIRGPLGAAILMDVPPEYGLAVKPVVDVTRWLRREGFSAPEILEADTSCGLLLIEDLGDDLLIRLCEQNPGREAELYMAAVDLLVDLQTRPPPGEDGGWHLPPYDMGTMMREALFLVEWYLPAATGRFVSEKIKFEFEQLATAAFAPVLEAAPVVVLRDYHAENLIWLPERIGHARVGLLDFQDALFGHPAYDLISLLEDARRDTGPEISANMLARYIATSGADPEAFAAAASILAAQRNLKIMGLFTRLCKRDAKPRYLTFLPRVWQHLQRDLSHPALAGLAAWVSENVPAPGPEQRDQIQRSGQ